MRARRPVVHVAADVLALVAVWVVLVAPDSPNRLTPLALLRIPVEGLALAALALVLPRRGRRAMAVLVGVPLGLLTVLKVLDVGFFGVLDRPFNPVTDQGHLRSAVDFVRESAGSAAAIGSVAGAGLLALVLVVGVPLSVSRVAGVVARHRRWGVRSVTSLAVVWTVCAVLGLSVVPGEPIAAADAGRFATGQVSATAAGLRAERSFDSAVAVDRFRAPDTADLAGLRGKDVLLAFVESYGRVAVQGASSRPVQALLDAASQRLRASGYSTESAFLTSPTFGGVSWLAHATLQSGVWVDNQWSYDQLLSGDRTTLSRAFGRAGWRTLAVLPSDRGTWPQGEAFYRFDKVYDSSRFGYAGPGFGFSSMPDQYALSAFQQVELAGRPRPPVMAEIDLASSHGPWAPLPRMLNWDRLGDGSAFDAVHRQAQSAETLWSHREDVPAAYMRSIEYSLTALVTFVERYGSDNLVLVLLGDHQPATIVSGFGGNHDVPVTVIARDPRVAQRISGWGWEDGMRPDSAAPVWRMDAFRDRFLEAFSGPAPSSSATVPVPPRQP